MKPSKVDGLAAITISLYLIAPIAFTFLYSISTEWIDIFPRGLTFRYYLQILSDPIFLMSVLRTILSSIVPILFSAISVLLAMYVILVYHPKLDAYLQVISTIPYAVQGVILAISVLSIYTDAPEPFSNRLFLLFATYSVVILPYMYQGIRNSLTAVNAVSLMEAAKMLGAGNLDAYFKVIVPNILTGVTVSAMLSSAIIFGDFVVVNIIAGNYYQTSQIYLYRALFQSGQLTSAIIVLLFVVTLILSILVYYLKNRKRILEEES